MLKRILRTLAAVAFVAATPATAQLNPSLTEAERGIRRDGDRAEAKLRIASLRLDAHIVGRTATITAEMLIETDAARPYEGNLSFLLPNEAVVTGYALNVGEAMIPGRLIEAPKARNVYEAEVRKGIDPGLAEVAGNRFSTRIFPIDQAHPRRFRVTFAVPFDPADTITLPIDRDLPIARVEATVRVDGYAEAPAIRFGGQALALTRDGASWTGATSRKAAALRDGLSITGGKPAAAMTVARHGGGEQFFVIADAVPPEGRTGSERSARRGPLRIYWDRSRSHRDADIASEIAVLVRLAEMQGGNDIQLVTFASDRPQARALANAAELRRALDTIVYRGATSLAGLDQLKLTPAGTCVMVSDGEITIDKGAAFAPDCALNVLTGGTNPNGARLGRLAQRSGGTVVRVAPDTIAPAVAALGTTLATVTSARDDAGRRIDYRALPAAAGRWLLVGRMPATGAVHVRLSDGAERVYRQDGAAVAAVADAVAADGPAALWAVAGVAALADDPGRHDAMAALARRYQVAGPGMSFLVLERPDQYLAADIAPPAGFDRAWMADYAAAKKAHDAQAAGAKAERLAFVLKEWAARRAWWAKRFTPAKPRFVREYGDRSRVGNAAPPPPPPPPPPPVLSPAPVPAPPAAPSSSADEVVVTSSRRNDDPAARARGRTASPPVPIKLDLADVLADRPYLAALNAAAPGARLTVLAEQEKAYGSVPTFYLDTAEWFRLKGDAATAGQLLLSALELATSDDETRQIVAFRLERDGALDRAVELAEHLAAANAEFRPQPGRDLALVLAARGRTAAGGGGRADLERAFGLLVDTALNPASRAFDGIEVVALMEANALIPLIERAGGRWALDGRLVALTDTDARIVMGWTADDADIDLWVDEPNGERVMYNAKLSSSGGQISNDMTDGYGPEEYAIRRAPAGEYRVRINGYDADRLNPNGPGHVLIRLQRDFARPAQRETLVDVDLAYQQGRNRDDRAGAKPVATLTVGPR